MKTIRVLTDGNELLKQLSAIFNPAEFTIVKSDMASRFADEDFSTTELIIIDPHLGDCGVATGLIDTLKSRSNTSRIPILLCSTSDNDSAIVEGLNAGATDFIILPSSTRALRARLRTVFGR